MYWRLDVFLKNEKSIEDIVSYDFKNEAPWNAVREEKRSLMKFLKYKKCNKSQRKFDCDNANGTCPLAGEVYEVLWGFKYKKRFEMPKALKVKFGDTWKRFGSDTMNSMKRTYNKALEIYSGDEQKLKENPLMIKFAQYTHTIGNFTLVPFHLSENDKQSFNQFRNTRYGDYFDLSLKKLKESVTDEIFKLYIDEFYLNDYVDENYNVLPLFSRHESLLKQEKMCIEEWEDLFPQSEDELNEYLETVIGKIVSRGTRIAETLTRKACGGFVNKLKYLWERKYKKKVVSVAMGYAVLSLVLYIAFWIMVCGNNGGFAGVMQEYGLMWVLFGSFIEFVEVILLDSAKILFSVFVFCIIVRVVFKHIAKKRMDQCEICKKLYAFEKVDSQLISEKSISMPVQVETKHTNGDVVYLTEQYIPGTRKVYNETYECKRCGYREQRERTIDKENI